MVNFAGASSRVNSKQKPILALRIQSAINGTPIPIVYGQARVPGTGIWTDGFKGHTSSAGKGAAAGKGTTQTYTANIAFGICEGPVAGIFDVWSNDTPFPLAGDKGLNLTSFAGTPSQSPWGFLSSNYPEAALNYSLLAYAGADPFSLGSSPSMPNLTWEVRGGVSCAVYETATLSSPYTVTPTYFNLSMSATESATIPPLTPFTYQATNYLAQGSVPVVINNLTGIIGSTSQGVIDANGVVYTRVSSAPAAHQYTVTSKGLYTFNAGDANTPITIINFAAVPGAQYIYQPTGTLTSGSNVIASVSSVSNLVQGQLCTGPGVPIGTFVESISGSSVTLSEPVTQSGSKTLTFWGAPLTQVLGTPSTGQFSVSVQPSNYGKYQFASGDNGKLIGIVDVADANAADVVLDFLTNPQYGCGFPLASIGDLLELRNYTGASGMFVSPICATPQAANDFLAALSEALNGEFVWSGASLNWKTYGDVPLAGYGYSFTPNIAPIYSFSDDDFMANTGSVLVGSSSFSSADPITTAVKSANKIVNDIKISFLDRGQAYNPGVAEAQDDASINQYGRQPGDAKQYDFFCIDAAAATSAQLALGREQVGRQFGFTVPWYYCLADPMDVEAITEAATGLAAASVRVVEITENQEDGSLSFLVKEMLEGTGTPTVFSKQASGGFVPNSALPAPAVNAPIIFAQPFALSQNAFRIGIIASGPANWGGADVYFSTDNSSYVLGGQIELGCTQGVTTASFASGSDPDTSHTLSVDLTESLGSLISGSHTDANLANTLAIVDGEFVAYSGITPTGTYTFDASGYIRRGVYGSTIAAHASGAPFGLIDNHVFYYDITNIQLGATIYVKLVSFNTYGGGFQDLADATVYTVNLGGPPTQYGPTNLVVTPTIKGNELIWQNPINTGVAATEIWRSSTSAFSGAAHKGDEAGNGTHYVDTSVTSGASYWYWIRSKDNAGNWGPYYPSTAGAGIEGTAGVVTSTDLGPGSVTSPAIGNGSIDSVLKFAGSITPVEIWTGAALPTTGNYLGRTLVWSADGKLYRYNGTAWTAAVATVDLTGQITGAQVATGIIDATKLASSISANEIFATAPVTGNYEGRTYINTTDGKIYRYHSGAWTAAVPSSDLAGTLIASQIGAGIIDATKLASSISANELFSSAPATGNYEGRTYINTTDGKIYRYHSGAWTTSVATTDLSGTISGAQLASGIIDATKIASGLTLPAIVSSLPSVTSANNGQLAFLTTDGKLYRVVAGAWSKAVDGADIIANSITAGTIAAGAIGTTQLAAGAIVANKVFIGDTSNMIPDPLMVDIGQHVVSGNTVLYVPPCSIPATTATTPLGSWWSNAGFNVTASSTFASANYFSILGSSNIDTIYSTPFQLEDSNSSNVPSYFVSCMASVNGGTAYEVRLYVYWYQDTAGTVASAITPNTLVCSAITSATAQLSSTLGASAGPIAAPTDASSARIRFYKPAATLATCNFYSPAMRRAADGSLVVNGSITSLSLATGAVTAGTIAAGAVTTSKIAAFAIGANQIAANAIVASKVYIGDTSNMVPDPLMVDYPASWSLTGSAVVTVNATTAQTSYNSFSVAGSSTTDGVLSLPIPVETGVPYYFACTVNGTTGNTSAIYVRWYSDNTCATQIGSSIQVASTTSGSTVQISGQAVAPALAVAAKFYMVKLSSNPSAIVFSGPIMRRATDGSLVVAGSITSSSLATGAVTASTIASGAITTVKIAALAVGAAQIAAQAIVASKVFIGDTSNMVPDPLMVDYPASWVLTGGASVSVVATTSETSFNKLVIAASSTNDALNTSLIAVEASVPYYVSCLINSASALQTNLTVNWYSDNTGSTLISTVTVDTTTSSSSGHQLQGIVTSPSTAASARVRFNKPAANTGSVQFWSPIMRRATDGTLVVAGAITSASLATGAVTATAIAANAVTASKMAANSVTAGTIAAGAVNAGTIIANNIILAGHLLYGHAVRRITSSALNGTIVTTRTSITSTITLSLDTTDPLLFVISGTITSATAESAVISYVATHTYLNDTLSVDNTYAHRIMITDSGGNRSANTLVGFSMVDLPTSTAPSYNFSIAGPSGSGGHALNFNLLLQVFQFVV